MRHLRGCFIGCSVVAIATVIGVVLLMRWWTAPIDIPRVPPPIYPMPNAFVMYRKLAEQMVERHEKEPALRMTADRLKRAVDSGSLSVDKEIRRYLQMWEPVRREYRRHLNKPCMTVLSYDIRETFPYLKDFRLWAYVEAADASLAIRAGNYRRALDDYETVLRVSEGLRNGGLMVHHLVAGTCISGVSSAIARSPGKIPAGVCDQLVGIVRQWEKGRVPAEQAWEHEWIPGINFLFTGGEFVYKTSEKGFLVYSVGEDGRDDDGKRAVSDRPPGDIGVLPYSPPAPAPVQQQSLPGPPVWMK